MSTDVMKLSPSEVYEFVVAALKLKQVPYVAGPSAIGKSQVIHQVAHDANAYMIDLRLSQMLSEDLTGLPERDKKHGKAKYLPFDTFPLEGDSIPDGYSGWVLFLDELSSASEEVLAAVYSLILDRTVGGKKLHPKCLVVAAGNRASDSAIARELPDTLITRMLICEMKVSFKDWKYWSTQDHVPSNEKVIDFLIRNPNMLYAPTKAKERAELETYPTPRGWEKVFAHVNMHEKTTKTEKEGVDEAGIPTGKTIISGKPISPLVFNLMSGAVNSMAARAFKEDYDENIQLPYPWEIAQSPASSRIPSTGVAKAHLIDDLANYFIESDSQTRDNVLIYVNRVGGEYSELFLSKIKNQLKETPSDKRLLTETSQRLNIDPLPNTTLKGGSGNDPSNPF